MAARLAGAHNSLDEGTQSASSEFGAAVAEARSALGEEAFNSAWKEGARMTMDQAVSYALSPTLP